LENRNTEPAFTASLCARFSSYRNRYRTKVNEQFTKDVGRPVVSRKAVGTRSVHVADQVKRLYTL
jgi:hypothetical protein